jgi:hypothetical protein
MTKLRSSTAKYIKTPFLSSVSSILFMKTSMARSYASKEVVFYMNSNLVRSSAIRIVSTTCSSSLLKNLLLLTSFFFEFNKFPQIKFWRICFKFILIPFTSSFLRDWEDLEFYFNWFVCTFNSVEICFFFESK